VSVSAARKGDRWAAAKRPWEAGREGRGAVVEAACLAVGDRETPCAAARHGAPWRLVAAAGRGGAVLSTVSR